ncbi:hypothetical protein [Hymenobacter psychrophilus]|uniref:Uncharacterized protein n=1 Tax=Hymenobacter psychrophilus TaxID=651662 RepID=A0A1H3MAQ1_9BACT|nr:hypothetical protein [Hymenobacter psychrophilus]SDY73761.1 hypothetical protein SAMN04488069_112122 [Hymenobacter psychrophilus]
MLLLTAFLPRLRLAFLTLTVLMVLGLNHQSVATLRVLPVAGAPARAAVASRIAVVKERVNLEATPILVAELPAVADTWLPAPPLLLPARSQWLAATQFTVFPYSGQPVAFSRARLLRVALSPQAP